MENKTNCKLDQWFKKTKHSVAVPKFSPSIFFFQFSVEDKIFGLNFWRSAGETWSGRARLIDKLEFEKFFLSLSLCAAGDSLSPVPSNNPNFRCSFAARVCTHASVWYRARSTELHRNVHGSGNTQARREKRERRERERERERDNFGQEEIRRIRREATQHSTAPKHSLNSTRAAESIREPSPAHSPCDPRTNVDHLSHPFAPSFSFSFSFSTPSPPLPLSFSVSVSFTPQWESLPSPRLSVSFSFLLQLRRRLRLRRPAWSREPLKNARPSRALRANFFDTSLSFSSRSPSDQRGGQLFFLAPLVSSLFLPGEFPRNRWVPRGARRAPVSRFQISNFASARFIRGLTSGVYGLAGTK